MSDRPDDIKKRLRILYDAHSGTEKYDDVNIVDSYIAQLESELKAAGLITRALEAESVEFKKARERLDWLNKELLKDNAEFVEPVGYQAEDDRFKNIRIQRWSLTDIEAEDLETAIDKAREQS